MPLGVPAVPGPVVGRRADEQEDEDDDAGSVSSLSSQSSIASDVAGPSTSKRKKLTKQVMMKPATFAAFYQAFF
jgi:hypothetical protein